MRAVTTATNLKSQEAAVRNSTDGGWGRHFYGQVSRRLKEVVGFKETLESEKS